MFQLDLKRTDVALASGRLDEAFALLTKSTARQHRDGQRLVDQLAEAFLERAEQHLADQRFGDARADAVKAQQLAGRQTEIVAVLNRIVARDASQAGHANRSFVEQANAELAAGRLDRAVALAKLIQSTHMGDASVIELQENLRRCLATNDFLSDGDFHSAQRELGLLALTINDNGWIQCSRDGIKAAIEQIELVLSGPLGLVPENIDRQKQRGDQQLSDERPLNRSLRPANQHQPTGSLSLSGFDLLQVDEIGGILLHHHDQITIGSGSSSVRYDLALQTEGPPVPVVVRREGEDYFAESSQPFLVNGQTVNRRLLCSGDSIAIGQRGRLRFLKTVAASSSAILQLTGAGLARRDIRNVVLMADSLVFGGMSAHFRLLNVSRSIILYRIGENLELMQKLADKSSTAQSHSLPLGGSVMLGGTRFSLVDLAMTRSTT